MTPRTAEAATVAGEPMKISAPFAKSICLLMLLSLILVTGVSAQRRGRGPQKSVSKAAGLPVLLGQAEPPALEDRLRDVACKYSENTASLHQNIEICMYNNL